MQISNKFYDIAKYVLLIVVTALNTLIAGLGVLYNFDTALIIGTISLFAAFFGSILKISSDNYKKANKKTSKKEGK